MKCFKCNSIFINYDDFIKHLKIKHLYVQIFKCKECLITRNFNSFKNFKRHIVLREIIELLFLEKIDEEVILRIETLINLHHNLYLKHFKIPLKPKHLFLFHYPSLMRKFGPLKQFWVMRHEGKHKELKQIANSTRSRVNICHTIAERLQLGFFNKVGNLEFLETISLGKIVKDLSPNLNFMRQLQLRDSSINFVESIEINKKKLKRGIVLSYGESNDNPSFGLIEFYIISGNKEIFGVCQLLNNNYFDMHMFAYVVEKSCNYNLIKIDTKTISFHTIFNSKGFYYVI